MTVIIPPPGDGSQAVIHRRTFDEIASFHWAIDKSTLSNLCLRNSNSRKFTLTKTPKAKRERRRKVKRRNVVKLGEIRDAHAEMIDGRRNNGGAREGAGRKDSYRPRFAEQAVHLCALGATDPELAAFFKVHVSTIWNWQSRHPEFFAALKRGKEAADDRVERSLYARATGYSFDSEKILNVDGEVVRVPFVEHVPPDVTAGIFWLKNRRPAEWRDKLNLEHEHNLNFQLKDKSVSIEDAQAMYRAARSMTASELARALPKMIEAKPVEEEKV